MDFESSSPTYLNCGWKFFLNVKGYPVYICQKFFLRRLLFSIYHSSRYLCLQPLVIWILLFLPSSVQPLNFLAMSLTCYFIPLLLVNIYSYLHILISWFLSFHACPIDLSVLHTLLPDQYLKLSFILKLPGFLMALCIQQTNQNRNESNFICDKRWLLC